MQYCYRVLINIQPMTTTIPGSDPGSYIPAKWHPSRWGVGLGGYMPGDRLVQTYRGAIDAPDPLDAAWAVVVRHNRDDRPDGRLGPSFSVGDVVAIFHHGREEFWASSGVDLVPIGRPTDVETGKGWVDCLTEYTAGSG